MIDAYFCKAICVREICDSIPERISIATGSTFSAATLAMCVQSCRVESKRSSPVSTRQREMTAATKRREWLLVVKVTRTAPTRSSSTLEQRARHDSEEW